MARFVKPGRRGTGAMKFLFAAVLSLWTASASAHNVGTSYVHLEALSNGSLTTRVDLSLRDLEFALGVDGNNDLRITWGEVSANLPAMTDLATHALNIS